ncbi:MAG: class I SAM-dependent methyltransferase [Granulosicoccus sp.]|nr:class I SAM-dependent methyltransferase [Granulosicoccus sp.]
MKNNQLDMGLTTHLDVIDRCLEPSGQFIVDAGCGNMWLSRELAARGAAVLAIDPDPIQAEKNRQAETIANVGFTETGAQSIPVENGSVDGVVFPYSLHHVPKSLQSQVFVEMQRILKPHGYLLIIEPVASGTLNDIVKLFHDEYQVRKDAQYAIDSMAVPLFSTVQTIEYQVPRSYKSWDDFVNSYISKSFNSHYTEQEVRSEKVRQRFVELGEPLQYRFEIPVKATYLADLQEAVPT